MRCIDLFSLALSAAVLGFPGLSTGSENTAQQIKLPAPSIKGAVSLEEAIKKRRSRRNFTDKPLTMEQLSQILWCAQGITSEKGQRAVPSAGATFPMTIYVAVDDKTCGKIPAGVYKYLPREHCLEFHIAGPVREALSAASFNQLFVFKAPVSLICVAEYAITTNKYGERGVRYVHMEAGHIGQNVHLQAEAMGLGTCMVGAFNDGAVSKLLKLPSNQEPLYIMPIGEPK